ncbi:MAG: hypothetical protein K2M44_03170 [Clostridia bacterium]|nr:hypothetical protein [Clostridia bacterium]
MDIGNILLDGYADRTDEKVFDGEAMQSLYAKLTGDAAKNTIDDVDALGTLTAAQIYAKNGNKDIVLTMDGQKWTVTHLTKDRSGNTIATLWLATASDTHQWSTWYGTKATVAYPSSMYSSSYIRANALNSGGSGYAASNGTTTLTKIAKRTTHKYARLTMPKTDVKGSLTDFIVTPAQVAYQETENQNIGGTIGGLGYTLPNDAYGTPSGTVKWYTNMNYSAKNGYSEWKDDYIWLPSITETGYNTSITGIWGLSNNQRSSTTYSWLRSSNEKYDNNSYSVGSAGNSSNYRPVTDSYAVRPALHLNLDLAAQYSGGVALAEPVDVTVEYKGTSLTLDDVAAEQKIWFNSDKISITYDSNIVDAGTYKVKAEIKEDFAADGLTFVGTPDADEGESDTIRYFNFIVTKKKIGITAALDSGGLPTVTLNNAGDVYSGDTLENGRAPSFGFTYTSSGGVTSDTLPTAVGTYTATAKIANDCNYEIDTDNSTLSVIFKIDKKSIVKPALSGQVTKPYSGVAQSFTLQGVTADVSLTLPGGMTYASGQLTATDAGVYNIQVALKDNGVATQWADGTDTAYELTVTITKKPLNITITAPSSWKVGQTPTITIEGDSLAADTTELYIYYCKHGNVTKHDDINNNKVIEGKKRTIVMPALDQGDYYIGVELYGNRQGNSNYEILAGVKTHEFKVLGNDITFTDADIKWLYNGMPVANPDDTLSLTYTGSIFRFSIDDSDLMAKGVKIDTTKGTNGYSGDITATNAKTGGTYSVTVYITEYDNTYAEFDAVYTLKYSIDKAKYDLSGLTWDYSDSNPLQFIAGKAQGITLTGSLPTGLTVSYVGNGNIPVGSYTTTASFNVSDAVNYYKPIASDTGTYLGSFEWSKAWRIDKATITCVWKEDNRPDVGTYNLPILQSVGNIDVNSMVTYKYYDYTDGIKGNEVNPVNIDVNNAKRYLAVAELKATYDANYVLDGNTYDFTIGHNRYPVRVSMDIDGHKLPYKPDGYTPNITVESASGLTVSAITLTYFKGDSTNGSTSIPVAVGKYRVQATLSYGGDNNYIEDSEFSFEIVKADIDVSGLKWQYTHGSVTATYDATLNKWLLADGTEAKPFVYDGTAHVIALIGADSLISAVSATASGNLSETNASTSYAVSATFTYDADCYNTPDFLTSLNWTVNKAVVDTSAIVWGYVDKDGNELTYTEPFVYTRVSGAAVEYSVRLINLPDALKDCISIGGDYTKSEAGTHRARYSVDNTKFDSVNYEPYVMPSGLNANFDWVISARTIDTPVFDGSWSAFDDDVHDFAAMFGLPTDWQEYVSITITLNGTTYAGLTGDDFAGVDGKAYKGYNAGEYRVNFALVSAGNNLLFRSRPQQDIPVSVAKYKYTVNGWTDNDEYSQVIGTLPSYYDYRYVNGDGNILTTSDMMAGSYYYREVYVKAKYDGNAEVDGETQHRFMMPLPTGTEKTPVAIPTLPTDGSKTVYYNGTQREFNADTLKELFGLDGFNSDYMEIVSEVSGATNAGEYKIKIRLTSGLYAWDNGDGTTSTDDVELTLTIAKAQLPSAWSNSGSLPTIDIPEELAGCLNNNAFNYTYTDENGNTVSASEMIAGKKYNVQASLKAEYAANFEFVDASGNVLPDSTASTSHEFDYSGNNANGGDNNGGGSGNVPDDYYKWYKVHVITEIAMVAVTLIIVVLVIVLIVKSNNRRRDKRDNSDRYDSRGRNSYTDSNNGGDRSDGI